MSFLLITGNGTWLDDASIMIQRLAFRAKKLRKFRFCVEEILEEQEDTADKLIGALRQYLPHTRLEVLEIHATIYSDYFGRELIEALPKMLRRLYVPQEYMRLELAISDAGSGTRAQGLSDW